MNEYTLNLLCHFVGRSRENDNERFELLKTIIEGKHLTAKLEHPDNPQSFFQLGCHCEKVGEVFGKCNCVCFCDIPNNALPNNLFKEIFKINFLNYSGRFFVFQHNY